MLLALDTSAAVTVAVHDGTAVLASALVYDPRHHAELLVPMVDDVLRAAGTDRDRLTAIAVGRGPGPFTGLRVGLVTARTLGLALGVPVHGVCSLDALAQQVVDAGRVVEGGRFVVATDARRREVYWARYERGADGLAHALSGPAVVRPAELVADGAPVFGRGAVLHADLLAPAADEPLDPEAGALVRVVARRLALGEDLSSTDPLYLRRPDAVPSVERGGGAKSVLGR